MTPIPKYDYRIAAGYNQPLGSLTNIELIADSSNVYFYPPVSYGNFVAGQDRVRGNGVVTQSGYGATAWAWTGNPGGRVTLRQDYKLSQDYCQGGRSGTVTIYTQTDTPGTYERYNAVMVLPPLPEAGRNFKIFTTYTVRFNRLVAL